jgi:recombination protein RecA
MAAPFREAEFEIRFGVGIDRLGEILDGAVETNLVNKAGSWYSFGQQRLGQGRDQARTALEQDPLLRQTLEQGVLREFGLEYLDAGGPRQRIRPRGETAGLESKAAGA